MKDIRPVIAAFVVIVLIVPAISLKSNVGVQHNSGKYSSGPTSQQLEEDAPPGSSRQTFKVYKVSTGQVEVIPAVEYICGVVAAEMPVSYNAEALKAQAAAAFTYACYHREYNTAHPGADSSISGADLSDDYHHYESYLSKEEARKEWGSSFTNDWNKIYSAVTAVKNKVVTYGGKPIDAEFFDLSTGTTESSANMWNDSLPYLVPVASVWDKSASGYKSSIKLKEADFKSKVQAAYKDAVFDKNPSKWLTVKNRSSSGNVISATLCGKTLKGDDVRSLFGLRSADFDASFSGGSFTFLVVGNGHDVGMSQYGAGYLAAHGKKWDEIVKYYYTGVSISDYAWP